jgi:hypothetical protein
MFDMRCTNHSKVRDTFGGAFYFGSYEWVKHSLGPSQGREASHGLTVFTAGLTCGAFSSAVVCVSFAIAVRSVANTQ